MDMVFEGFPAGAGQFLRDLRDNNNKEWFEAHKQTYIDALRTPAQAFVMVVGERLQDIISPEVYYDTRTNGSGSLMRINRDVRFSKDKSSYKENLAMIWWQGPGKKMQNPAFGLQITPTGVGMMAGMFGFDKDQLVLYRDAVDDDKKGKVLESAVAKVQKAGDYELFGEALKKVPRGYDADHPRADLLKYKGLYAHLKQDLPQEIINSADFVDITVEHLVNMAPIQQWLVQVMS
ncbi:MAG: TIGR02453 family protein [Anaerolineaceae bacterium]|nr:TIGR02453 family protein [Anaerolineaceae bacterium]